MKILKISLLLLTCLLLKPNKGFSQELNYKSYTLFIYNFMKYIEWPDDGRTEFVIGVYGDSPVFNELLNLAKAKKAKGKTIILKKINTPEDALTCNLVYLAPGKSGALKPVNEKIKGKAVLVVGEREGLASKGAALSFVTLEDDVLKFDINKAVLDQQGLKIPSSLLALGIQVK